MVDVSAGKGGRIKAELQVEGDWRVFLIVASVAGVGASQLIPLGGLLAGLF